MHLQDYLGDREKNNFNLLRLLAALLVLISHCLLDKEPLFILSAGQTSGSYFGMAIFFYLSGLLVSQSLDHCPSRLNFIWRRILRIYPAAILVVVLSAFALGPIATTYDLHAYFRNPLFFQYLRTCFLIKVYYLLPGTFTTSPLGPGVNNSLWSLTLELKLYASLLLLSFIRPQKIYNVLVITLLLILIATRLIPSAQPNLQQIFGPAFRIDAYNGTAVFFIMGILTWRFRHRILIKRSWLAIIPLVAILAYILHILDVAAFLLIPAAILLLAVNGTSLLHRITPTLDLSYGTYIYAFPIEQLILQYLTHNHWTVLLFTLTAVLPLALLSWYLVESKALRLKHLIK